VSDPVDANLAVDIGGKKRFISADYSPFGDTSLLVTQKGRGEFSGAKHRRVTVTRYLGGYGSLRNAFPTGKQKAPVTVRTETTGSSSTIEVTLNSGALTNYIRDPTTLTSGAVTNGIDEMFILVDGTFTSIGFPKVITNPSGSNYDIETNATVAAGIEVGTDIYVNAFQPGHTYSITGGTQVISNDYRSFSGVTVTGGSGTSGTADVLFQISTSKMVLSTLYTRFQTGVNFEEEDLITFGAISGATPNEANLPARVHLQSTNLEDLGRAQRLIDLIPGDTVEDVLAQKGFMFKADHRNTPTIFIGGPTMGIRTGTQLNQYPEGIPLGPADAFFMDITDLSRIYVVADADPTGVYSYIYWMDM
jgi:hypothetical protein